MQGNLTFNERDEFGRRVIAENLIKLIVSDIDVSPLIIDGGWGTGKTEFSKKLKSFIINHKAGIKAIYIDAFKQDYSDNPILIIVAAIAAELDGMQKTKLIKKAIPVMKASAIVMAKLGVSYFLRKDMDVIAEGFKDEMQRISDVSIENTIESLLAQYASAESDIKELMFVLSEISKNNKLVIIVDELDRCKPDFAISIIETIKHAFDVENIYFVITMNKKQLGASMQHRYGKTYHADEYMDKFIKYTIELPYKKVETYGVDDNSLIYWSCLASKHDDISVFEKEMHSVIKDIMEKKALSLRNVEDFVRHLRIYQTVTLQNVEANTSFSDKFIVIIGVFLYCFCGIYSLPAKINDKDIDRLAEALNVDAFHYSQDIHEIPWVESFFYALTREHIDRNSKLALRNEARKNRLEKVYAENFIMYSNGWGFKKLRGVIECVSLYNNRGIII